MSHIQLGKGRPRPPVLRCELVRSRSGIVLRSWSLAASARPLANSNRNSSSVCFHFLSRHRVFHSWVHVNEPQTVCHQNTSSSHYLLYACFLANLRLTKSNSHSLF